MISEIRRYVDELFKDAPATMQAIELKEEVTSNLIDKYVDLTKNGVSEEEAYRVAVASVGDVNELISRLTTDKVIVEESDSDRKKYGLLLAGGIGILIASFFPLFVIELINVPEELGLIPMFLMWALGVGMIIYANISRPKYMKNDDTVVESFKEWNSKKEKEPSLRGAVSGALWLLTIAIYMLLSFATSAWQITWILFLIAAALQGFISVLFSKK